MASISKFYKNEIVQDNEIFSEFRSIIETSFYGNNVKKVNRLVDAYNLAKSSKGTIITDIPIYNADSFNLPSTATVLVFNDGGIVGRTAAARNIVGEPNFNNEYFSKILREAVYQGRNNLFYHGEAIVGLDKDFSLKSHILCPEGFETNFYSYLLNFQFFDKYISEDYYNSKHFEEGDLFIYSDPTWKNQEFPNGLVLIDPMHNVAAVLGLRYFGELKKATLSLAWAVANRNGFTACHGGLKQYNLDNKKYTMAVFGLSGSGKSTITLSNHNHELATSILHDDAFIINDINGSSIALEPSYFDKIQDYNMLSDDTSYFLTCQNVGVVLDSDGNKILALEDIRNKNGRTVKSRFVTPTRVDHIEDSIDSIFWIMKDDSFPPVIKINNPTLSTIFGLTLSTKRTSAENIIGTREDTKNVIEPFANPFRSYPLSQDYLKFTNLFKNNNIDCFIINTGYFNDKKITPSITLKTIEDIVEDKAIYHKFEPIPDLSYIPIEGYLPKFDDKQYLSRIKNSMVQRLDFIKEKNKIDYDCIPDEAVNTLSYIINMLKS